MNRPKPSVFRPALGAAMGLVVLLLPFAATAQHLHFDSDGVEIAYRVDGDGLFAENVNPCLDRGFEMNRTKGRR